jgi:hypothetical protein
VALPPLRICIKEAECRWMGETSTYFPATGEQTGGVFARWLTSGRSAARACLCICTGTTWKSFYVVEGEHALHRRQARGSSPSRSSDRSSRLTRCGASPRGAPAQRAGTDRRHALRQTRRPCSTTCAVASTPIIIFRVAEANLARCCTGAGMRAQIDANHANADPRPGGQNNRRLQPAKWTWFAHPRGHGSSSGLEWRLYAGGGEFCVLGAAAG